MSIISHRPDSEFVSLRSFFEEGATHEVHCSNTAIQGSSSAIRSRKG